MITDDGAKVWSELIERLLSPFAEPGEPDPEDPETDPLEALAVVNMAAASALHQTVSLTLREMLDRVGGALGNDHDHSIWPEAARLSGEEALRSAARKMKSLPADYANNLNGRLADAGQLLNGNASDSESRELVERLMTIESSAPSFETRKRRRYARIKR